MASAPARSLRETRASTALRREPPGPVVNQSACAFRAILSSARASSGRELRHDSAWTCAFEPGSTKSRFPVSGLPAASVAATSIVSSNGTPSEASSASDHAFRCALCASLGSDEVAVPVEALLGHPLEGREVHVDQPEAL